MTVDEEIAELLHHDLSINLDADTYRGKLNTYECTLLYMISIGREYISDKEKDFKLLIFDFDDKITVNKSFRITNYTSDIIETKENCNLVLEFIEDTANSEKYYMIQNKQNTKSVEFKSITSMKSILSFTFKDFKEIIDAYLIKENIQEENLIFQVVNHQVDFHTGSWLIDKPFLAIPK